ncbi:M15 family metallopeptidase [Paenibacillus sp. FSL L8-0463]|uniref:M15 family metallopeptidase n=1 Tax=Paenibacillus sp. FSL L8-0463 TaxID=2954687 RepID=UPI0031198BE1
MLTLDQVKLKSHKHLIGLHPVLAAATVALIERCYARGVNIIITQGLRTIEEQNALYAQGRTKPGKIVTNAKGGSSYHNFGLAIDFVLLLPDGKQVSWDLKRDGDCDKTADWMEVVQEAKALGFEWGGDFVSIKDAPHFQMTFGLKTAQLRAGKEPTAAQVKVAYAKIDKCKGEADEVKKDVIVRVLVDGKKVADGVADEGVTYTPARAVAEALGATVDYDVKTKTMTITSKGDR